MIQETGPDRGTVSYSFDLNNNLTGLTDARGVTRSYRYDALDRLTGIAYPDGTQNVSLSYDTCAHGSGRLCAITDHSGSTGYAYDAYGNLTAKTDTREGIAYTQTYQYNASHQRVAMTLPSGRTVSYRRDAVQRISGIDSTLGGVAHSLLDVQYSAAGQVTGRSYGNGVTETRQYDLQGRLTQLTVGSVDQTLMAYDASGNLLTRANTSIASAYGYDALDRLTQQVHGASQTDYRYDGNGNRLGQVSDAGAQTYAYSPTSNRLSAIDSQPLSHDAAGNLTQDAQGRTYHYDQAGRLSAVEQGATTLASYRYGADGLRSHKVVGGAVTVYLYDLRGNLIGEAAGDGSPLRDYLWHDDVPVAQIDQQAGEILTYLHADHLQTARLATDQSQAIVWRWEGSAFGDTPAEELSTVTVNLRFPGQYFDSETGLHYNWNRYYDPATGRYITSDPIGLGGGTNTYAYANGNPLFWVDPWGLYPNCFRGIPRVSTSTKTIFDEQILLQFRILHPQNYRPSAGGNFPPGGGKLPIGPEVGVDWWLWEHTLKRISEFKITKTITVTTIWCEEERNCEKFRWDNDDIKEQERKELVDELLRWFNRKLYKAGTNSWPLP